jgi:glycosyltransferase involved in cell wall biosynthesis
MRIARVSEYVAPCPGGKEIHVSELSRHEVLAGHEVELFYRFGAPSLDAVAAHECRLPNRYHRESRLEWTYLFGRRAAARVTKRHREGPFDVVHLHGDWIEARVGAQLARRMRVPAVLTVHAAPSRRWVRRLARSAGELDAVICVGSGIAHELENAGVDTQRLHVISSGVDTERVAKPKHTLDEPARRDVLFVGSLVPMKGIELLVDGFRRVRAEEPSAQLVVVGDGPERRLLEGEPGVVLLGHLPRDEVYGWMHRARVLALTSRDLENKSEGMPTVVMEALAAGLAVVATDAGSVRDVLTPDLGVVVAAGDTEQFARALTDELRRPIDPEAEDRRIVAARTRDWVSIASRVDAVLEAAALAHAR